MKKTTVIYHSADYDGIFCREIARKFLPDAELIGWDYGQLRVPVPSEGTIYILDLSPDCLEGWGTEVTAPFIARDGIIWIDHHKSAIEKFAKELPGYRIDGVAACRLAWQWFIHQNDGGKDSFGVAYNLPRKEHFIERVIGEPWAVRLAGEYDIWDKRDPASEVFQFGLRSPIGGITPEHFVTLLDTSHQTDDLVEAMLEKGALLQNYQQEIDKGAMQRSFQVEFEGLKFIALNSVRFNSLTFASLDLPETGHDALIGFYWTGKDFSVSLYHANHRKDIDLSLIAVKHGGGGHRGACGFRAKTIPFIG